MVLFWELGAMLVISRRVVQALPEVRVLPRSNRCLLHGTYHFLQSTHALTKLLDEHFARPVPVEDPVLPLQHEENEHWAVQAWDTVDTRRLRACIVVQSPRLARRWKHYDRTPAMPTLFEDGDYVVAGRGHPSDHTEPLPALVMDVPDAALTAAHSEDESILLTVPRLNAQGHWEEYEGSLQTGAAMLSVLTGFFVRYHIDHEEVRFVAAQPWADMRRHTVLPMPTGTVGRVALYDVMVRSRYALGMSLVHFALTRQPNNHAEALMLAYPMSEENMSWPRHAATAVAVPDVRVQDCFVLYTSLARALRGGLSNRDKLSTPSQASHASSILRAGAPKAGAQLRKRPAAYTVEDLHLEDNIVFGDRVKKRRVVVYIGGFDLPLHLAVSAGFTKREAHLCIAQHLALHPSWLVAHASSRNWNFVCVRFAPTLAVCSHWCDRILRVLGTRQRMFLGMRATRARGLSKATVTHEDFARDVNAWLACWLPVGFVWNAVGLLQHADVPAHVDRFNTTCSIAITLSAGRVFLGHYSDLDGCLVRNLITHRPAMFDPTNWHSVEASSWSVTLVAYSTTRLPSAESVTRLNALGFRPQVQAAVPLAQPEPPATPLLCSTESSTSSPSSSSGSDDDTPEAVNGRPRGANMPGPATPKEEDSDELSLLHLVSNRNQSVVEGRLTISPTLPFYEEDVVLRGGNPTVLTLHWTTCNLSECSSLGWAECLHAGSDSGILRGGAPKSNRAPRVTWEGDSADSMLVIQTEMQDHAGQKLPQLHISQLCKEARGAALVNWSSWVSVSTLTSTSTLVVYLPGHRPFEVEPPPAGRMERTDIVIMDRAAGKRFPRHMTAVQLGNAPPKPAEAPSDVRIPAPAAPIEMVLEVDSRASEGANPRVLARSFIDEALQKTGAHNKLFGYRDIVDTPCLLLVVKIRVTKAEAEQLLAASGRGGVFTKVAAHCADQVTRMALIWLDQAGMDAKPVVFLRNTQQQLASLGGLCRCQKTLGLRAEARLAGRARALLGVQRSHQFDWNEAIIPTMQYVVRGLPAMLSDVETATALHDGFKWNCVPPENKDHTSRSVYLDDRG
eukprot:5656236-Amphidinium_carterae.2